MKRWTDAQLHNMVEQVDPDVSARLNAIDRAIRSGGSLPPAEGVLASLNPASIDERAEHRFGGWARRAELGRNLLTLAPLLVTWYTLGAATYNFGMYARAHPTSQDGFLALWERNFDGEKHWRVFAETFSRMAQIDVGLLLALALASVFHFWLTHRAIDKARAVRRHLERRADEILRAIDERRREHDRALVVAAFGEHAGTLAKASDSLAASSASLDALTKDVGDQRARIDALAKQRELELDKLAAASTGLETGVAALVSHAAELKRTADGVAGAAESLGASVGELAGLRASFDGSLTHLTARAAELTTAVAAVLGGHDALHATVAKVDASLATQRARLEERDARSATQHAALLADLAALAARVPNGAEVARAIVTLWEEAQTRHLEETNAKLRESWRELAEQLKTQVVDPLVAAPFLKRAEELIAWHSGTVGQLSGSLLLVHQDAEQLGAALDGLFSALGISRDDAEIDIEDDALRERLRKG